MALMLMSKRNILVFGQLIRWSGV